MKKNDKLKIQFEDVKTSKKKKKEWRIDVFSVFGINFLELGLEIDFTRLKVLYIVFRELSDGKSGFGF